MKGVRIELTREQKKWLREHFATTKNAECCKYLGIGDTTLHRIVREMKLKKDARMVKQWWDENRELAHEVNEATGFAAQSRSAKRQWQRWVESGAERPHGCFVKGESNRTRLGEEKFKECIRKGTEKREKARARDRRRVALGLEPLTRLVKPVMMTRGEILHRHTMKVAGYLVFRGDPVIYYGKTTKRSEKREATAQKLGLQVLHISKRVTS